MTTAFVFDTETVLCCHTPDGWWPIQVKLPQPSVSATPKFTSTNIPNISVESTHSTAPNVAADSIDVINAYQLGCVELAESLGPSDCSDKDLETAENTLESTLENTLKNKTAPATRAITHNYAINNNIALPKITTNLDSSANVDSAVFISYRQLITHLPVALAAQLSQAIQLLRWQADTQFCSRCSAPVSSAQFAERSMVCAVCRLRQYPRVQPCVITAITRPNPLTGEMQILLAHHHRYGTQSAPLQYGLIAGFVEVGESLEHAVVREVAEEVSISLTDIRYVSSQPWPFPSNLMLGFRATYAGGDILVQKDELSHAEFFDISNLPKIPFKGSIAYDLIAQILHEQGVCL
ncbi:NAD(+) diphosphatase [Psychrobacter frigidicola]|uniref:NAD(+) diphosphatase n=1 Tax=Psychrobacter frigidicola TaxID=45611 RepID=A0A5C7A4Y4_9GAMM|nr:NAD(+) diphosphatase [Psychrobacter frigidicola]TXD97644.1 NAD(+) diphosphatase [Psychrobacter frigidicola]